LQRTGTMDLPLHGGAAPQWLVQRMKKLGKAISDVIVDQYGQKELLLRLSNPDWFQALSCVLAFDWHSSGTTTVLCGVLKEVLDAQEHGVAAVGGKGIRSRQAVQEIPEVGEALSLHPSKVEALVRASRLSAKVDTALLQDGFSLYHHTMFISEGGHWAVVQQGMRPESRTARRYHWLSWGFETFVEEPHSGIACDERMERVLNLTSSASRGCREKSLDLALQGPGQLQDDLAKVRLGPQKTLMEYVGHVATARSALPCKIDWEAMKRVYDFSPKNYEDFILVRGIGPSTVRALALISDLIYGQSPDWKDPVKYSYCLGGKDGVPYPVDRASYDESIEVLTNAIKEAKLGSNEKMDALRRLNRLIPPEVRRGELTWLR